MASAIEPSLTPDHGAWSQRAYAVLEEMSSRGNTIARLHCQELKQLEGLLGQLSSGDRIRTMVIPPDTQGLGRETTGDDMLSVDSTAFTPHAIGDGDGWLGDLCHDFELGAEQLLDLADSLDFSGLM